MTDPKQLSTGSLHRRLEALAAMQASAERDEMLGLLHALEAHQLELEVQSRELHDAQAELEAARDRYADLCNFAPIGYLSLDAQGLILEANIKARELLGHPHSQLIGTHLAVLAPTQSGRLLAYLRHLFATDAPGEPGRLQLTLDQKGETRHLQLEGVLIEGDRGATAALGRHCRIVLSDITAQRQAAEATRLAQAADLASKDQARRAALNLMEDAQAAQARAEAAYAALQRSESTYRSLFENLLNSVAHCRMLFEGDTPTDIEYLAVNPAFAEVTGIREKVVGRRISQVIPGYCENNPESLETFGRVARTGRPTRWEHYLAELDRWFAFMIYSAGNDEIVILTENITERKRAAAELEQYRHHLERLVEERTRQLAEASARAEAANRAKSAFLANMSHEIRTPMNAVLGLTHLLQHDGVTPPQAQRLEKIESSARHLLSIINDILDLSKIETGRLELEAADFTLAEVLEHVRALIEEDARAKGVAVLIDADSVPHWLRGDRTRLRQALLNYAGNAVKFTKHGSITLRARLLEQDGDSLLMRFEVEDTGIGIDPDQLGRLFQAFEQADLSTTRRFGGTGLGLAIARHLASLMGGEAGAQSVPGQGSRFWLTARLARGLRPMPAEPEAQPINPEEALRRRRPRPRVLLVEDNPINLEVATDLIQAAGLMVDGAEDGRVALEKAVAGHYDLILMDVQMPVMDGLDATRALRTQPAWRDKPILAMTANAFDEDRTACLEAGMNDFVAKPVDPGALYATLLQWLTRTDTPAPAGACAPEKTPAAKDSADALLQRVPGLDLERGLKSVQGRTNLLIRLLRSFAENNAGDMAAFRDALGSGDPVAARRIAHTLKGASATLGLEPIRALAAELEHAVTESTGQDMEALASTIEARHAAVAAALGESRRQPRKSI